MMEASASATQNSSWVGSMNVPGALSRAHEQDVGGTSRTFRDQRRNLLQGSNSQREMAMGTPV